MRLAELLTLRTSCPAFTVRPGPVVSYTHMIAKPSIPGCRLSASRLRTRSRNGLRGNFLEADFWPEIILNYLIPNWNQCLDFLVPSQELADTRRRFMGKPRRRHFNFVKDEAGGF
jgi:hypothetical protein